MSEPRTELHALRDRVIEERRNPNSREVQVARNEVAYDCLRMFEELADEVLALRLIPDNRVRAEILEIMRVYREQEAKGYVNTPGGLEHMGDVWRLLSRWEKMLQS